MAEIDNRLHISTADVVDRRRVKSESDVRVPRYSLYGDSTATRDWFVNVEPLDQRASALDWKIGPHTHPKFTQLVFVSDGSGEMTLDGDILLFEGPCVLVVPPFRIHGFRYAERSAGTVVTIENNYLGDLVMRAPGLRTVLESAGTFALSPNAQRSITGHVVSLGDELMGGRRGGTVGAEVQLLQIILTVLRDRPLESSLPRSARAELADRFSALVEARYREQPGLRDLADTLGVTLAQLRNACRETTGMAPLAILHDRIAAEAKRYLIYSTVGISEIGYSLGFEDAAYFTRFFKRTLGVTPTKFRQG